MKYNSDAVHSVLATSIIAFTILMPGCGPSDGVDLGAVTGTVTFDGQPLPNASVSFHPQSGRGSFGTTDEAGSYKLTYMKGREGATVGKHKVTITSKVWAEPSRTVDHQTSAKDKRSAGSRGREELLPAKYRLKEETILSAEIESGSNELNFDLKSD